MAVKLIMRWDVRMGNESDYSDYVANEFIPGISKLGISEIQAWFTAYGDCEQILVSGITQSDKQMTYVLGHDEWERLQNKLADLVDDFNFKVIKATAGFQI